MCTSDAGAGVVPACHSMVTVVLALPTSTGSSIGPINGLKRAIRSSAVLRFGLVNAAKMGGSKASTEMAAPRRSATAGSPASSSMARKHR
ncbi:MAG: hypothetical protein QM765_29610 [Myxococcales bacterium]